MAIGDTRQDQALREFHQQYYGGQVWTRTYWLGVPVQKCPLDLWRSRRLPFPSR